MGEGGVPHLLSQDWWSTPGGLLGLGVSALRNGVPEVLWKSLLGCLSSYHTFQSFPAFSLSGSNLVSLTRGAWNMAKLVSPPGGWGGEKGGLKSLKNCTHRRLRRVKPPKNLEFWQVFKKVFVFILFKNKVHLHGSNSKATKGYMGRKSFPVTVSFHEGKHCPQFLFNKLFFKLLFETFQMLRGYLVALT